MPEAGPRDDEAPWALWRGARECYERFRAAAVIIPRGAWVGWATLLVVGAALAATLTLALTLAARALDARGMAEWDRALLLRIEHLPLSFNAAIFWEAFGASSMLVPLVAVAIVVSIWRGLPIVAATFLAALALGKPLFLTGWLVWNRARPDLIAGGIAAPDLHSFPSGHTVQTAALYGLLTYLWLRRSRSVLERALGVCGWVAIVAIVGLSRLRLGAHWPSDVIVAAVLGTAWLAALVLALRHAEAVNGR